MDAAAKWLYLFRKNLPFIFLSVALLTVVLIPFVMHGLARDGRLYSCFALDMAKQRSSIWQPLSSVWPIAFLDTPVLTPLMFHEHPPFAFYMQSLFIQWFGDGVFVDKLYFFVMAMGSLCVVILFWCQRHRAGALPLIWIPIFSWVCIVGNYLPSWEGGIESTLVVLTTMACFFMLQGCLHPQGFKRFFWLLLGSLCVLAGFLTKGLQALFPVILPLLYTSTISSKMSIKQGLQLSMMICCLIVCLFSILVYVEPVILENILAYLHQQVFGTFNGQYGSNVKVPRILNIVWLISKNLFFIIAFTVAAVGRVSWVYTPRHRVKQMLLTLKNTPWMYFFFLLALAASLPVGLSPRQSSRYLTQSFPFWTLFFTEILTPHFQAYTATISLHAMRYKYALQIGAWCLVAALLGSIYCTGGIYRSASLINDLFLLQKLIPPGTTLSMHQQFLSDAIHRDFIPILYRYHQVQVSFSQDHDYYIQQKTAPALPPPGYLSIAQSFNTITVFKKRYRTP